MILFFDTEFTGLHQHTSLISIGIVDADGRSFYAEFTDYKSTQIDWWVEENVLKNLRTQVLDPGQKSHIMTDGGSTTVRGDEETIVAALCEWLSVYDLAVFVGDCPAYDWVLFCELFGGAMSIPENIYYIPLDLATLLASKGMEPDTSRRELCKLDLTQHNALDDAKRTKSCWEALA